MENYKLKKEETEDFFKALIQEALIGQININDLKVKLKARTSNITSGLNLSEEQKKRLVNFADCINENIYMTYNKCNICFSPVKQKNHYKIQFSTYSNYKKKIETISNICVKCYNSKLENSKL